MVETLSFRDCRGGVLPDDALKEIRRVNGVLSRLRQAQEQLPPKFMHGMVAPLGKGRSPCRLRCSNLSSLQPMLRNSVENFCSHMAYGLRTHSRDHPDNRLTVVDLIRLVQMHPEDLDAPLAYAMNCFQALNVCARTLRLYSIDYSHQWPEQEDLKDTIDEILDLLTKPAPAGAGLPHTITVASYNQLRIESGLLADYSWMNEAFKMWNQDIEDMDSDIDRGLRPGHVYLMPGDTNFPRPIAAHPPWAQAAPRVGDGDSSIPEGPVHPSLQPTANRAPPPVPPQERTEQVPKRSRTTPENAPRPTSSRTTAASEAASSSARPRPTVGSATATPSTSEPEAPPPESGWDLPIDTTNAVLITHHFKVKSGKVYGTKVAKRRDGGGFMNAVDETPRPVIGKTFQQIYLRRLVTMLARSGGLSANVEAGFHLPTFILKGDQEWLRLYNQMYHRMHLGCTQCLPEPAILAACVFDDRQSDEWIRPNFPEIEIAELRGAEASLCEVMHFASREDGTIWKAESTLLVMDYNLHSKASNSPIRATPLIAMRDKGWSAMEVFSPPEANRPRDNIANFASTVKRACDRLREVRVDIVSRMTVHIHLSLYGVTLAPLEDEVIEEFYIQPITELHEIVPRSAIVTINDDPLFNGLDHNALSYGIVIKKIAKELRANGCLVLTTSSLWPKLLSVTGGAGHRIKADQADLGWALFEKSLMNEKALAICMLDTKKINILSACIKPFNLDHERVNRVFSLVEDEEVKFIGADVTAGEEQASATRDLAQVRRAERQRSDLPFGSEDVALIEPEPYYDNETFWWKIEQYQTLSERATVPGKAFYCEQCRGHLQDSESLRNARFGSYCPGCAFKEQWRQYPEVVSWDDWKRLEQNCTACAVYLYRNYFIDAVTGEAICNPASNIKSFIQHCATTSRSSLAKTVSSLGALRVPVNMAIEYCQQGRARHLGWGRALSHTGNVCYIAYYDPGNAAYAGYMNCLFTREEITEMCRGSPDPSEELLGDIIEIATGLLVVALRFPDMFPMWGAKHVIEACLRGIERSFHRYAAVESITLFPTQSRKRRRPAGITPEEQQGLEELTPSINFNFFADPADRADEEGEAVQTQIPQPVEEPEYHAAPEEDPAVSIATGEEPEEEEEDHQDDPEGVPEMVRMASDGFRYIQDLSIRDDISLSCGAVDHNTFNCRVHPANPGQIALGLRLLETFFNSYRPPQRGSLRRSHDMEVDQANEEASGAYQPEIGHPAPTSAPHDAAGEDETLSRDHRPPLPRVRPTTAAEGQGAVPSPTVEPATARPKSKARPATSRWNRAATTTGVVELIYDQPSLATALVRAREGQDSVRGVELRDMGLASNTEVGHYVRRTIGEVVAIHPRRGDPLPQDFENVPEYFHTAKGVFGGDLRVMPRRGGTFLSRCWDGFECFEDLPNRHEYHQLDRLMYDFNSLLRHKIGRYSYSVRFQSVASFPTLECDEGGWVSVDTLLERDAFWQPEFANRSARGNPAEKSRRLRALMKANWAVGRRTQRFRLQFLGVKVCPLAGRIVSGDPFSAQP